MTDDIGWESFTKLYTKQDILNLEKEQSDRLNIKNTMEDRTQSEWDRDIKYLNDWVIRRRKNELRRNKMTKEERDAEDKRTEEEINKFPAPSSIEEYRKMTPENKKKWETEVERRQNIKREMDDRPDWRIEEDIRNEKNSED